MAAADSREESLKSYLGLFFIAAFAAWLVTPAIAMLGRRLRAYGRSRERGEVICVPRLGGLAIVLAVLAGLAGLAWTPNGLRAALGGDWLRLGGFLVPGAVVLLVGLYDDVRGATPGQKLAVQMVAAAAAWWLGFRMNALPVLGFPIRSTALSFLLTVVWIVAVTNAVNLLDGLDGLAVGVAFFVAISVFAVSLMQRDLLVSALAVILAGALLGFLRFNSPPARIFLGDTGSLFLGCLFSTLALAVARSATPMARTVPYIALGLPLLDMALTMARRAIRGKALFAADCDHVHHRLVAKKRGYRQAILTLYAVAAATSLGSILILYLTGSRVVLGVLLAALGVWLVFGQLQYPEFGGLARGVSRLVSATLRPVVGLLLIREAGGPREPEVSK